MCYLWSSLSTIQTFSQVHGALRWLGLWPTCMDPARRTNMNVTARAVFHCRTTICDSIGGADVDWNTSIPLNFLVSWKTFRILPRHTSRRTLPPAAATMLPVWLKVASWPKSSQGISTCATWERDVSTPAATWIPSSFRLLAHEDHPDMTSEAIGFPLYGLWASTKPATLSFSYGQQSASTRPLLWPRSSTFFLDPNIFLQCIHVSPMRFYLMNIAGHLMYYSSSIEILRKENHKLIS